MDFFSGLRNPEGTPKAGEINTDLASVLLGNAAQAVMGGHQDSWQAQMGKVGSQLGQSKIADKNMREQQAKDDKLRNLIAQALLGNQFTPDGEPGVTTGTTQQNADGTFTYTAKGNVPGPRPAGVPQPGVAPPAQTTSGPRPAGVPQPGVLPPAPAPSGPPPAGYSQQNLSQIVPLF